MDKICLWDLTCIWYFLSELPTEFALIQVHPVKTCVTEDLKKYNSSPIVLI